jgi:hypothetical protein
MKKKRLKISRELSIVVVLLLLNVGVFGGYFAKGYIENRQGEDLQSLVPDEESIQLADTFLLTDDEGEKEYTFRNAGWERVDQDGVFDLDALREIKVALRDLRIQNRVARNDSQNIYGLNESAESIELRRDGNSLIKITIGSPSDIDRLFYAQLNDKPEVYLVKGDREALLESR